MIELSIIIPVYNVEEYISKCILSIQDQDIPKSNYEIIVINDGSPDNSRDVVIELMQAFDNIVYIEQQNSGVSIARNVGIEKARGKYIFFIDPDDYILPGTFGRILNSAGEYNAQVVFLGYQYLNEDNSEKASYTFSKLSGQNLTGIEAYHESMSGISIDPDRSWAILFDREFINKAQLRYTAGIPYLEDGEFMARVLCLAESCIFEGHPFYIRTTRAGSATNSNLFYSDKAIDGFFFAATNLKKFKSDYSLNNQQIQQINQPITKFTLLAVQVCVGKGLFKKYKLIKQRLKNANLNKIEIEGCSSFYYKFGLVYNISNDLFYFVWSTRLLFISMNSKIRNALSKGKKELKFL